MRRRRVGPRSRREQGGHLGELRFEHPGDLFQLRPDVFGVGLGKMVRMAAATISAEASGTLESTLRMKCTR